jgi:hypothetical protein
VEVEGLLRLAFLFLSTTRAPQQRETKSPLRVTHAELSKGVWSHVTMTEKAQL